MFQIQIVLPLLTRCTFSHCKNRRQYEVTLASQQYCIYFHIILWESGNLIEQTAVILCLLTTAVVTNLRIATFANSIYDSLNGDNVVHFSQQPMC